MSGGSRGIGLAIAKRVAREGAQRGAARQDRPAPPEAGGHDPHRGGGDRGGRRRGAGDRGRRARRGRAWRTRCAETVERFGGIDIVVNNASAINLAPMRDLEPKRYDLMLDINVRGTFVLTRAALPHLRESDHAHVLTLSPPLSADPKWLAGHSAYTVSKMGMTMITLGRGRRRGRGRHRRQLPVAADADRHRRGPEPARRRRGDAPGPHARDLRRRRVRDPAPRPARVHGQRLHRRRGARRGRASPTSTATRRPRGDLAIDLFVELRSRRAATRPAPRPPPAPQPPAGAPRDPARGPRSRDR